MQKLYNLQRAYKAIDHRGCGTIKNALTRVDKVYYYCRSPTEMLVNKGTITPIKTFAQLS